MKLDVIKLDGGKGGSIELADDIFGIEEIRADILALEKEAEGLLEEIVGGAA